MRMILVCVVLCGAGLLAAQGQDVKVVEGGAAALIVVQSKAPGTEQLKAAQQLQEYIIKMTGQEIPIYWEGNGLWQKSAQGWKLAPSAQAPNGRPEIHVGWTSRALKEMDKAKVEKLDVDGFLIRTTPEAIFLVGPKDWSTAYAVYTFLEDFCGVRWFLPGETGEDVPRSATLSVPIMEKTYRPAYLHRQYSGFQFRDPRACAEWGMHQKVRPRLNYHHNLWAVLDVRKYGEKYPDLYPIIGGHRRMPGAGNNAGWQPCLTHPKAVDFAVEYAKEYFAKNPDASSISLGINDGGGYCECPRCMEVVQNDLPKVERRAKWFFQFANAVAERFDTLFPDKQIGYLLYGECHLTSGIKLNPRLIGFEVFPSFRLIEPEKKALFDQRLAELSKAAPVFGLYDWFYGDGLCIPRLQVRQAKYWLQHGYEMGARHVKAEAYMNWGLDGFKYWMHTKLMWDPTGDVDQMMAEFLARFFRESAKPMGEYFKAIERYTVAPVYVENPAAQPGEDPRLMVNFHFRYPDQLDSFPPKAVEECEPFLDEAERLAQSDLVRRRIAYFRTAFNVAKMLTLRHHLVKEALPLLQKPETLAQGMPLLARALGKDLDVEQYYKWVLRDDPFCVRYPEESMFASLLIARRTAGATLTRGIVPELQKEAGPVTPEALRSATDAVLERAWAGITDAEVLSSVKESVGPLAGKVMISNKAPAPKLDGKLDDECWKNAAVYSDFNRLGTGKPAEFRTEARVSHDGERLYIAARCLQDTKTLLAWTHGRDDRVWREDGVEIMINRVTDTKAEQRCQVIVNTQGNIWDYYNGDVKWDGDIKTGIAIEPDSYTMEVSIPLAAIGIDPAKERFIRFNCGRNVYARQELQHGEAKEISTWYLSEDNLNPDSRGWLVFNN